MASSAAPLWVVCEHSGEPLGDDEACRMCGWTTWHRKPDESFLRWEPHYRQDVAAMRARGDFTHVTSEGADDGPTE